MDSFEVYHKQVVLSSILTGTYYQTKIRYEKLHKMVVKYEAGTLDFTPKCSLELLKEQKRHMGLYLNCLEIRAENKGIEL